MSDKKAGDVVGFVVYDDATNTIKSGIASRRDTQEQVKVQRAFDGSKSYRIAKVVLGK